MECGDPRGEWGRGFFLIPKNYMRLIREKGLSVYTCHVPMDYHKEMGTSIAIANALGINVQERFIGDDKGEIGVIGDIPPISTKQLKETLEDLFDIPYCDFEGKEINEITRVVIVAGCGDKVKWMKMAEEKDVQAYISGEIHCHIDNDYGRSRLRK
jgi:putative NIF3 family GTP cyclohydrolase 1 type 2